ncbi:MAG: peptidoglycan editing factor PgeF [Chloroflexota bacterium]
MIPYQQNGLTYFHFESLPVNGRLQHAVFSRQGGHSEAPFDSLNLSMSVPDERDRVYANRRQVYGLFGRDTDTVVHAHLVHGNTVARVTQANNGEWVEHVDALITDEPGCVVTMNFADCTPVIVYDPVHNAAGIGHAGWRGTVANVAGAMVASMSAEFGSVPSDMMATIGPCIGPCCYEVGEDVATAVRDSFGEPDGLLQPSGDRYHFDLPAANRRQLADAGVATIETSGLCTACRTDLFFSHRAEKGRTGRFGVVVALGQNGSGANGRTM